MVKENEKNLDSMKVTVPVQLADLISFNYQILNLLSCFDSTTYYAQYVLRENFVSEMVKIIIRSDRNNDNEVNRKEGQLLALRLSIGVSYLCVNILYFTLFDSKPGIIKIALHTRL